MITLTLLHPIQSIPVQSWSFEHETVIRIGRSTDNHVILYSAVVSRHHVELRKLDSGWEIVNLGANGTYLDGKRITQVPVEDGVIIRLARSGPNVQIHIGADAVTASRNFAGEKTLAQRVVPTTINPVNAEGASNGEQRRSPMSAPFLPSEQPRTDIDSDSPPTSQTPSPGNSLHGEEHLATPSAGSRLDLPLKDCCQRYIERDLLFCPECGQPLRAQFMVGNYLVIKLLQQDAFYRNYLGWREGHNFTLRTLKPEWSRYAEAEDLFEQEAKHLLQLHHPGLPRFIETVMGTEQSYLVIDAVFGQNLQQLVDMKGTIALSQAIPWMLQLCDVLSYLHHQTPPVLHHDIRPEILIRRTLTTTPELVLTGFSACKALALQPTSTPGYSAPEQQQGLTSPTSDLYALGTTLVYLLTGKSPSTFYAQREQGFRFYPEYAPGLTPDLVTITRKLTNPNPTDRYATAQEVAEALQQVALAEA
ncbi:protein kinase domain-containing protein [Pantanalinema sp. GBBB05]|uniref:protein kinase domain-containing protein n=1 Tax=Pantanalinema sp. GBBB05 TaxID=2604139 RepID=UPI001DF8F213|nr:FHA domain-containing protein [Pantanalinema sp. GBBB05]